MPRNMSFSMTTEQVRQRTKTVTRRFAWWSLEPGTILNAVEKAMGLKRGEKVNRLARIRIISVRREPLNAITQADVVAEGFPGWTPDKFVQMLVDKNGCDKATECNRIEFEYLDEVS